MKGRIFDVGVEIEGFGWVHAKDDLFHEGLPYCRSQILTYLLQSLDKMDSDLFKSHSSSSLLLDVTQAGSVEILVEQFLFQVFPFLFLFSFQNFRF